MKAIKDIIPDVIQGLTTKKRSQDEPEAWLKQALPKKELKHIKFRYLRKGVLGIAVDSSVRLYHLNLQKPRLLAKLGKKSPAIKDIRFYIGEM